MKQIIWRIGAGLLTVLVLAAQAGCKQEQPIPTPDELTEGYTAAIQDKGYSMEGGIQLTMNMGNPDTGNEISIPLSIEISMDRYNQLSHGWMEATGDMGGESTQYEMEFYMDPSGAQYMNQNGTGWVTADCGVNFLPDISSLTLPENAEVEKSGQNYLVSAPLSSFLQEDALMQMMGESTKPPVELIEAMETVSVTYVFDAKTGFLSSITMADPFSYYPESGEGISMGMELELAMEFSKYGEVTAENVMIPEDVLNNASGTVAPEKPEDPSASSEQTFEAESEPESVPSTELDDGIPAITFGSQTVSLPFDYSVLTDNGWYPGTYTYTTFLAMDNEEYDDQICAYNRDTSGDLMLLKTEGVYGIQIEAYDANNAPEVKINGITWGMTEENVIAALGEPDERDDLSFYENMIYHYITADGADCELQISIDAELGVTSIEYRIDTFTL